MTGSCSASPRSPYIRGRINPWGSIRAGSEICLLVEAASLKSSIWRIQLVSGFHSENLGHQLQVIESKGWNRQPLRWSNRTADVFIGLQVE